MSAKKRAATNSAALTKTRVPLAKSQSSFASALDEIDSEEDEKRRQSCTTLPRKLTFGQCESQVRNYKDPTVSDSIYQSTLLTKL